MKLTLGIHFIKPNIFKILSFQHVISIKIIYVLYLCFHTESLKSNVNFYIQYTSIWTSHILFVHF